MPRRNQTGSGFKNFKPQKQKIVLKPLTIMRLSKTFFSLLVITSKNLIRLSIAQASPPDVSNVFPIFHSSVCSDDKSAFLILVLVISHPGNIQRRTLIRESYPAAEIETLGIRRLFVLGTLQNEREPNPHYASVTETEIQTENDMFSDIIKFNLTENYKILPLKCLAAFTWAVEHCKNARYIVRTDDDVFIEYYALQRNLSLNSHDDSDDEIKGFMFFGNETLPERNSSYVNHISYAEYPFDRFPDWLTGALYIMSPKTMGRLVEASRSISFIHIEDVYFTSLVANAAGVRKSSYDHLLALDAESANCCIGREGFDGKIFACEFLAFEQLIPLTLSHAHRIKEHGRFCFHFACLPYSEASPFNATHVKCF